jgi:transposase
VYSATIFYIYIMQAALAELSREDLIFEITTLREELAELKRLVFGSKSERFVASVPDEQLSLGLAIEEKQIELIKQTIEVTRTLAKKNQNHPGRMPLPSHLPRVEHVIEPLEHTSGMKKIGEEITESLEYTPGKFFVNKYVRPKYARPQGEGVIIGNLPSRIIEKGIAGASLLAYILTGKYVDHLPLHRLIEIFKREGIKLAASTVSDWANQGINPLRPLSDLILKKVTSSRYLQADETPIKVLDKDKKGDTHKGYYWVYHDVEERLVYFDYREGRSAKGPTEILQDFKGYLQTDGYGVYDAFGERQDITLIHCMAHARRKFEHALENNKPLAEHALSEIQKLYAVERALREAGLTNEERKQERQEKSVPILQALGAWMQEEYAKINPKSSMAEAIRYSLSRWDRLSEYANNGMLEIDSNLVENAIRPVAIGRKNYLFAGSHDAARRSAMMYTFTASCKKNEVNPYEWLKDVLSRISDHPINRIEELLPANWKKIYQQKLEPVL